MTTIDTSDVYKYSKLNSSSNSEFLLHRFLINPPFPFRQLISQQDFKNLTNTSQRSFIKVHLSYVMVKIGSPSPKANTLDIEEEMTYANTSTDTWQIIKFFLEEMKPVSTAELDPEDRECHICAADLTTDANRLHGAVRLPCNHIFGESCIMKWLSPYVPCLQNSKELSSCANTCPMCRQVFFPEQSTVSFLPEIEARLMVWDKAYAHVGISLSEQEARAREDLVR